MNQNCELINNIFKNAEMAKYTLEVLLCQIKNKDNNIKAMTNEILTEYDRYIHKIKKMVKANTYKLEKQPMFSKMAAKMGIKKDIMNDNSDSSVSKMIIQGITMGILEIEQLITRNKDYDKDVLRIAKDFIKFQKNSVEELKKFL